jgi:hypothetical protein
MGEQEQLAQGFETNSWLIRKFAAGLTHEDSLAQPSFRANNFNWVLGHILVSRDRVLKLLDQPSALTERETAVYDTGSESVTEATALSLPRLMAALESGQKALNDILAQDPGSDLDRLHDAERGQTVRSRIEGLQWHETYHIGQLEILRQVSGEREAFP